MAPESEASLSNTEVSVHDNPSSQVSEDVIREQIRRQRRRRIRSARQRSKHKKQIRIFMILIAQAIFLLLLIYVWFKVSTAVQ